MATQSHFLMAGAGVRHTKEDTDKRSGRPASLFPRVSSCELPLLSCPLLVLAFKQASHLVHPLSSARTSTLPVQR